MFKLICLHPETSQRNLQQLRKDTMRWKGRSVTLTARWTTRRTGSSMRHGRSIKRHWSSKCFRMRNSYRSRTPSTRFRTAQMSPELPGVYFNCSLLKWNSSSTIFSKKTPNMRTRLLLVRKATAARTTSAMSPRPYQPCVIKDAHTAIRNTCNVMGTTPVYDIPTHVKIGKCTVTLQSFCQHLCSLKSTPFTAQQHQYQFNDQP